jgi:hypothetical protein
VQHVFEWF